MEKPNPIRDKSFAFSLRIVSLYVYLCSKKREFVLSKQILKSGTSVGANIEEALQGESRRDFISKLSISLKEAHETRYWLKLLVHGKFITRAQFDSLLKDIEELIRLLVSIVKTSKVKP